MKNQQQKPPKAVQQGKKGLIIKASVVGIIVIVCGIFWFMNADSANARASTPAEIAAQEAFQKKLITSQEEFQKKIDVARNEAEKSNVKTQ